MNLIVDFPQGGDVLCSHHSKPPALNKKARRVSFNQHLHVKFVQELTTEYKADLWFSEYEMKSFQKQAAYTVKKLRDMKDGAAGGDVDNFNALLRKGDRFNFVGLESHLTASTRREIVKERKTHSRMILYEQRRQIRCGVCNHDMIANISEVQSDKSRRRGRIIGQLHALICK